MNVIWSSTTGVNKSEIYKIFEGYVQEKYPEKSLTIVNLEELLIEELGTEDITQILNSYNREHQKSAWKKAFEIAEDEFRSNPSDCSILCTHLIYYRNSQYFSPMDYKIIKDYGFEKIISFIDDIYLITKRIENRNEEIPTGTHLSLRDILAWRSIEFLQADFIASITNKPTPIQTNIVSIKQPVSTLGNLLFEEEKIKMYIGHPITAAKNNPAIVEEIEEFKGRLHQEFTVFDPTTIDERLLTYSLNEQCQNWKDMSNGDLTEFDIQIQYEKRWPINHEPILCTKFLELFPIQIKANEIIQVLQAIDDQIRSRDYQLIGQSDMMVAYRPNLNRRLSIGVFSEMQYTRDVLFKHCLSYSPSEDESPGGSPFQAVSIPHNTKEGLLENIRRFDQEQKKGPPKS